MSIPHKQIHPVKYEPISARELLTQMKTISELMIDLAYSALLFSNKELGEWVMELEDQVDALGYQLFMTLSMSVRNKTDAEMALGLFRVCVAANRISDAAADIASLAVVGQEIHPLLRSALLQIEERLVNAKVADDTSVRNQSIGKMLTSEKIGVDIIAIRRDGQWIMRPDHNFVLHAGDVIFMRGSKTSTSELFKTITGHEHEHESPVVAEQYKELINLFLRMKETSEFMVSIAYAAIKFDDRDLAEEVFELEDNMDRLYEIVGKETLNLSNEDDVLRRWTLLRVATSLEAIADAAWEMAMVPLSGLDTHPIINAIAREADEIVARIQLHKGSPLANHRLNELALMDKYGIYVLSIKRAGHWFHRPSGEFMLRDGDTLVVDGYREGLMKLQKLVGTE